MTFSPQCPFFTQEGAGQRTRWLSLGRLCSLWSVWSLLFCKTDCPCSPLTSPATSSPSSWSFIKYVWCSVRSHWGNQGWLDVLLQCSEVQTRRGMKSWWRIGLWDSVTARRMTGRKPVRRGPGLRKFKILWDKTLWPPEGLKDFHGPGEQPKQILLVLHLSPAQKTVCLSGGSVTRNRPRQGRTSPHWKDETWIYATDFLIYKKKPS